MPALTLIFFSLLGVWFQSCLLAPLTFHGVRPDLLLILTVFLALYSDDDHWPLRYWGVGLLKDLFSAGPLGLHALLFLGFALGVRGIRAEIFRESYLNRALLVFLGVMAANGTAAAVQAMAMAPGFSLSLVWGNLLEATCSALVASPVMSVLMLFRSSLGIRDPRDLTRVL